MRKARITSSGGLEHAALIAAQVELRAGEFLAAFPDDWCTRPSHSAGQDPRVERCPGPRLGQAQHQQQEDEEYEQESK